MLKQGEVKWVNVVKGHCGGNFGHGDKIIVSLHKGGRKRRSLNIAIPYPILHSAGIKAGDYVSVKYCNGICQLDRTPSVSLGYKVSTTSGDKKGRVNLSLADGMKSAFFSNGVTIYASPIHETRPNSIQFSIGEDATSQ